MTTPHHGLPDLLAIAGGTGSWRQAIASVSDAYFAAQSAVIQLAEAGGAQIRERPAEPGASVTTRSAEPLADAQAAQILPQTTALLPETIARVRRDYAERARGDGITWEQIGEALGLDQGSAGRSGCDLGVDGSGCDLGVGGSGYDLGVGAFEYFTGGPDPWYRASFRFCCASCGGYITDRGPFENYPEDNEHGHAEGCVRLAADIAGWHAQQDAWEAGGWPVTLTVTQR